MLSVLCEPAVGRGRGRRLLVPLLVALAVLLAGVVPGTALAERPPPLAPPPLARLPGTGRVPALRMPVAGAVVRGFEAPSGPYGPGHRGIDIAAPVQRRIRAPAGGRVVFAGPVAGTTWVSLLVAPGVLVTLGPLLEPAVAVGGPARALAPVGRLGPGHGGAPRRMRPGPGHGSAAVGRSGPGGRWAKLHVSVRLDGVYVDPMPYLIDRPRPRLAPLLAPGGLPGA